MKVVALTVEHQNRADKEGQQHRCLFSDWSHRNVEMLLLTKRWPFRPLGFEQIRVGIILFRMGVGIASAQARFLPTRSLKLLLLHVSQVNACLSISRPSQAAAFQTTSRAFQTYTVWVMVCDEGVVTGPGEHMVLNHEIYAHNQLVHTNTLSCDVHHLQDKTIIHITAFSSEYRICFCFSHIHQCLHQCWFPFSIPGIHQSCGWGLIKCCQRFLCCQLIVSQGWLKLGWFA